MTSELGRPGAKLHPAQFQNIPGESDILEILDDVQQDLPEASQPKLILSSLLK